MCMHVYNYYMYARIYIYIYYYAIFPNRPDMARTLTIFLHQSVHPQIRGGSRGGSRSVVRAPLFYLQKNTYSFSTSKVTTSHQSSKTRTKERLDASQHLAVLFLINAHIHYSMCMSKHFYFC